MIPFVRTRWELEACLELVDASPLGRQRGLQRWVMAEVPSVVYRIPEYAELGIDGVSIGSNDLTQLMLGVDRDSEICAELFDESDAAVLDAIGRIISAARDARHDVVAVRTGTLESSGIRRASRALRHHIGVGEPGRGGRDPARDRLRRAAVARRRRSRSRQGGLGMTAEARSTRFEPLDRVRCLQLLSEHNLGRLAVVISGQPLIFPVNYTLDGDAVVFRTDPGNKLRGAIGSQSPSKSTAANPRVIKLAPGACS